MDTKTILLSLSLAAATAGAQQRPVVQTKFTADPAPIVQGDTVYLFASHDADDAPEGYGTFKMEDWLLYTSTDMVNWQERGSVVDLKAFKWLTPEEQKNGAWAIQVVRHKGKYYMYAPIHMHGIGVLTSDNIYGPWTDPIGRPLIGPEYDSIDPTVLQDDDGSVYLYWGNPNLWWVKLNEDMVSFEGKPNKDKRIHKTKDTPDPFDYQEGPWAYKRDGKYYMTYASTCCPEGIGWAWSDKPHDEWQYGGHIMDHDGRSSGNHPDIIDFMDKTYCFGFNYLLNDKITDKHHERRSICVTQLTFDSEGRIRQCPWWEEGKAVQPLAAFNPYRRVEAETMAWSEGLKTACELEGTTAPKAFQHPRVYVTHIDDGDWLRLDNVDFKRGAKRFSARIRSTKGGSIELHTGSKESCADAVINVGPNAGQWVTAQTDLTRKVSGKADLYLVFRGEGTGLFELDWWELTK